MPVDMQGYAICHWCVPRAQLRIQEARTAWQREQWTLAYQSAQQMRIAWQVNLIGAMDVAGSLAGGAGVAVVSSAAAFTRSVAASIVDGLPAVNSVAPIQDAPQSHDTKLAQVEALHARAAATALPESSESLYVDAFSE